MTSSSQNDGFFIRRVNKQIRANSTELLDVFSQLGQQTSIEDLPEEMVFRIAEKLNQSEISSAALSGSAFHGVRQYRKELRRQYNLWSEFVQDVRLDTLNTSFIENNLEAIDLKWYNNKTTENDFWPLQNALSDPLTTVKSLQIYNQDLKAIGLVAIANALLVNTKLKELKLLFSCVCNIDDLGLSGTETFIGNDYLRPESLPRYNPIGIQTLANSLKVNKNLERLMLRGNSIGDQGAIALAGALRVNQGLKILDISDNRIGISGASEIARALSSNSVMTSLNLFANPIAGVYSSYSYHLNASYNWTAIRALADTLRQNVTLQHIDISNISLEQMQVLEEIGRDEDIEIYVYPGTY